MFIYIVQVIRTTFFFGIRKEQQNTATTSNRRRQQPPILRRIFRKRPWQSARHICTWMQTAFRRALDVPVQHWVFRVTSVETNPLSRFAAGPLAEREGDLWSCRWRPPEKRNREMSICLRACFRTMTLCLLPGSASRAFRYENLLKALHPNAPPFPISSSRTRRDDACQQVMCLPAQIFVFALKLRMRDGLAMKAT